MSEVGGNYQVGLLFVFWLFDEFSDPIDLIVIYVFSFPNISPSTHKHEVGFG